MMTKSNGRWILLLFVALLGWGLAGCATTRQMELPEPNMDTPGWEIRRGQAVWRPKTKKPEVAGDFFSGINRRLDSSFAEFNKATIPVLETRTIGGSWELGYKVRDYKRTGSGGLNPKVIWLHVPYILAGNPPPEGWEIERTEDRIVLTQDKSGERLELYPFKVRN